ncbi:MAG TPA: ATP-binding protein [Candidatus Glassbacteria bacterium]|nr:ATP-binding protein [Candidatus Glassbacteria bacterium]
MPRQKPDENPPQSKPRPRVLSPCEDCGNEHDCYAQALMESFGTVRQPRLCPECREKARRLREVQQQSHHAASLAFTRQQWLCDQVRGIPERYRGKNFDGFDATGNEQRVSALRAYAESFPVDRPPKGIPSLLLAQAVVGVGKTHLACAILQTVAGRFDQLGREVCPYQFWPASRVKQRVFDAQRFGSKETLEAVYRDFASMWLLVLDDVGKEKLTGADAASTYEIYYTIINERYNANLPMIITSNLGFEPWQPEGLSLADLIGNAGVSRLMEMTGGQQYLIAGHDRR